MCLYLSEVLTPVSASPIGMRMKGTAEAKPLNSIVLRLAATSSRLSSHDVGAPHSLRQTASRACFEAKLSAKMRKLRMGTQAAA